MRRDGGYGQGRHISMLEIIIIGWIEVSCGGFQLFWWAWKVTKRRSGIVLGTGVRETKCWVVTRDLFRTLPGTVALLQNVISNNNRQEIVYMTSWYVTRILHRGTVPGCHIYHLLELIPVHRVLVEWFASLHYYPTERWFYMVEYNISMSVSYPTVPRLHLLHHTRISAVRVSMVL